jgi:hypothetical protein
LFSASTALGGRKIAYEVRLPMLDVHLPHKAIHGFREFFIHLFTITMGLLIATQIESCMEWRHHVHVAEEARKSLRAEIQSNLNDQKQLAPGLKKWRSQIDADLAVMERIQEHPEDMKNQHAKLAIPFSAVSFSDTAWPTCLMRRPNGIPRFTRCRTR